MERGFGRIGRKGRTLGAAAALLFAQPGETGTRVDHSATPVAAPIEHTSHRPNTGSVDSGSTHTEPSAPLSAEDEARRREHEKFRDQMWEKLRDVLPEGFSSYVVTGVEGKGIYDEFITIQGPDGKEYGQVYPDEGDGGHLIWNIGENEERFLKDHGIFPPPYELTAPEDISLIIGDVDSITKLQKAEDGFRDEWPSAMAVITQPDGTMVANPEYYAAQDAFVASQQGKYAELAILQEDDQEEEDEDNDDQ